LTSARTPTPDAAHAEAELTSMAAWTEDARTETAAPRGVSLTGFLERAAPWLFGLVVLALWQASVQYWRVPAYLLPGPWAIGWTLVTEFDSLFPNLLFTLKITVEAFVCAAIGGLALGMFFTASRWVERTLFPYAVALQVTPVVAIAPLIIVWVRNTEAALLICAWLVAFFPVVSNTAIGLNSFDHNLRDLFLIYRASRLQTLLLLKLPSAAPYYFAGLRVAGGLALIGAVVAEFVAGTGGSKTGLAYRILEAGYRLQISRMFAALALISATGIAIFFLLSQLQSWALRHWHESALRDNG
jgi:NitT/TauT family transport system permease protein